MRPIRAPTAIPFPRRSLSAPRKGKAILVSGHDLKDLEELLKQTAGKGINVYTHGEMLPTHGYPELKKYPHFYGHYGTAWQNQQKEFADFPGAILMTTNCLRGCQPAYKDNIFTTGLVGWPGVPHITNLDFSPVITRPCPCQASPKTEREIGDGGVREECGHGRRGRGHRGGKEQEHPPLLPRRRLRRRKARPQLLHGICREGPQGLRCPDPGLRQIRFFDKDLGDIGGIPRLLDIGQCNDAYSAVAIAVALAGAFNVGVNDLPLSMVLSWYEQKAVCDPPFALCPRH